MEEVNLHGTTDTKVWTQEWLKTIEKHPEIPTDEGAMLSWFANAIMAGYDYAHREMKKETEGLREKFAELAHEQWSHWMDHLFSKGTSGKEGTWVMPSWAVKRWKLQAATPYSDLSKGEQDSDRIEADKFLALLANSIYR